MSQAADRVLLNQRLATLATAQRGVVSRDQLIALGFTDGMIRGRCDQAWLHRLAAGTYAVGHVGLSRRAQGIAALLHTGPDSGLSFWTAARIWEMTRAGRPGEIHVSVRGRRSPVVPGGVKLHRPRRLDPAEIVVHRGLRVTTPERTLTDLLPELSIVETTRMLEQMITHLGRSPDALHAWGAALHGAPGRATLSRALDEVAGPAILRSEFEDRFRSLCQEAGLPAAQTNYSIDGWETDAVWLKERVAIELDSYRWHGGRWQFHRDRRKGLAISKAGFELIRLSWPQIKYEPSEVAEAVGFALARGSGRLVVTTAGASAA